ncbi:SymE family type I addiction module toxin [Xanthomonas translucens]|uniref:SymE family type I addiction module toxin n=1 Tax=Xanthomonas campestris pv. translucens TaxID=343 RepID=UPI0009B7C2C4|nr:SymE family type I addiction module toxin [Xanthomonas translucens]MBC3972910.1 type I addiction module toxin, SymE family [Xanthomonas translucens pv. undulosa]MCT8283474.1 type I toxin-antitoxin system SymE family toxin [Xanthomonas translucens pv. undulosa]MCT8318629.1 type I toxin-antitoxin system SymE family toxin [Xanthomonas translucens pv. undulosa]QSQ56035.1 type I addiction module toxin, SymE family [Xanthomonas translucens pv. undulosa]UKE39618.1 SymE family type I addiction modu
MSRNATSPKRTPAPRRTRKPVAPEAAYATTSQMPGLSLGDMSRTTLFHPVPTDDERPPKRAPRPRQPAQCTIGATCHDVLVDGRLQSQEIPILRLSGQWLAALGFVPGSKPQIAVVDGALVITAAPQE